MLIGIFDSSLKNVNAKYFIICCLYGIRLYKSDLRLTTAKLKYHITQQRFDEYREKLKRIRYE